MRPKTAPPDPASTAPSPFEPLDRAVLAGLSDDRLVDEITTWGGRIAAGEAQLLAYIGEFDERRAWVVTGILSCAQWLSWKIGMGVKAASDRVRTARALRDLPETAAAFHAGRVSFTQVRAITRIATAADESLFLRIARRASGEQIERLAGGIRRSRRYTAEEEAKKAGKPLSRLPKLQTRYDSDGNLLISVCLPPADGAVVLAALEAVCSDLDSESAGSPRPESSAEDLPMPARTSLGQGFLGLCQAYLQARAAAHPDRARRDRSRLTVQVDPLSGWARLSDGALLPPEVAAREGLSLPAGTALRRLQPSDLTRHDGGRERRAAGPLLHELLVAVDGQRCRFPGCRRHRRLHAHHIIEWLNGGRTDLVNMVLLCTRHHTVVHEAGFRLKLDPVTRMLAVSTKGGRFIPDENAPVWQSAGSLDPAEKIGPDTLPPLVLDRLELHYAVSVLLQNSRHLNEKQVA